MVLFAYLVVQLIKLLFIEQVQKLYHRGAFRERLRYSSEKTVLSLRVDCALSHSGALTDHHF